MSIFLDNNIFLVSKKNLAFKKKNNLLFKLMNTCFMAGIKTEPRSEKTDLRGFRPGPTQTGLYNHTRWLDA